MTNAEKYQRSIRKIIKDGSLAVHKVTGEPFNCEATDGCDNCLFKNAADCNMAAVEWLAEENKEKEYTYKLSKFEYDFLNEFRCQDCWLAREYDMSLIIFIFDKPYKSSDGRMWFLEDGNAYFKLYNKDLFQFVKFDDKEAYSVREILANCEVIEDEDNN